MRELTLRDELEYYCCEYGLRDSTLLDMRSRDAGQRLDRTASG